MPDHYSLSGTPRTSGAADAQAYECRESLLQVIQDQIIPRLLNSQQFFLTSSNESGYQGPVNLGAEVLAFADFCIQRKEDEANALVDRLMAQGLRSDRIFLELITPAARHLGVLWEQDRCDFTQVTCGLAQMHQITYRIGFEFQDGPHVEGVNERVMLACAPGSQHFLGLTIVADFFRKTGADVVLEVSSTETELVHAVANEWFDVIGLSVAIETQLPALPGLVRQLRASSGNPKVRVVLGGPIFLIRDLRPEELGADAISTDAREAVVLVKKLVRSTD
ncbi:MAG: cobalamin B12-binding domain-containing protein [Hylemonella sp.]|uniref:cobalamin B12-binding domain-containing protein n=1 Tax=Hylemonella sp. TaxID=2066020 RepID=UPI0022C86077|nr:cobalamin B12-binding domain-containing protein [Hylemonella sp.]MCZ8253829.1 cobalamin B12-binding domain-containing protein [Hylemonella sp.]